MPLTPETARLSEKASQNLALWAEVTALAIELRRAVLAKTLGDEAAERAVWADLIQNKEEAWTHNPS